MSKAATKFKQTNLARQAGELARLKVVQGPDYGSVFVITGARAAIGRGDENDIVILDLKASRRHAVFVAKATGWEIEDAGSANGVLHNGKPTRGAKLRSRDTITLGETTLEFLAATEANTMMLSSPARSYEQVQHELRNFEKQKNMIAGGGGAAMGGENKSNRLLIIGAAGALAFLLFGTEDPGAQKPKKKKVATTEVSRDLASFLPGEGVSSKSADSFFKSGFREYRSGNYIRAKTQFETALQIAPGHALATLYLQNCNKAVEEDVKKSLFYGKRNMDSGKYRAARGNFEAVLRLLYRDQSNPSYVEAKENLDKIAKEAGGEGS